MESRTDAKSLEQDFANLEQRLAQERQKNARLEQDVKSYQERETFLEEISVLKVKLGWVVGTLITKSLLYQRCERLLVWHLVKNNTVDIAFLSGYKNGYFVIQER